MHPFFSISANEIQQLDDTQARELIAKLCQAEVRRCGLSIASVTWGGDQRAKDGGVDVRVDIRDAAKIVGYIPRISTIFQVKAVKAFNDSTIKKEMRPKSVLLPSISELAQRSGAYIIASTKGNESDLALTSRKATMQACIDEDNLTDQVYVDFYDARKIADWAAQYLAIVIWIKFVLGQPIIGWKPYAPWAYREDDIEAEYILDDKVKVFAPSSSEAILINSAINCLRRDLSCKKSSVRIVGLSGVGKTRLVQALFDNRIVTEAKELDRNNVIYTDISDNPSPQPNALIGELLHDDAVVIVDNCGAETHSRLTELVKQKNSQLKLITVEYDIRDDLPEDTLCYRLETSSEKLIEQLLTRRFTDLTQNDIAKIAEFSGGNARVAFALAGTSESKGQLAKLENAELFKRLFWQNNVENEDLLRCAEVCSLLYSFDVEDLSSSSELALLASLAEISIQTLNRHVVELQRRGLVQQRGKWRAVLPHAIANRLASRALDNYPEDQLIKLFVSEASARIAVSFSRRLGYLHESKKAGDIVSELLNSNGLFSDLACLNEFGKQVFINISPVNQGAALTALLRASQNNEFVAISHSERWRFARVAKSIAYEVDYFNQAFNILVRFAEVEPPNFNHNSILAVLKQLFSCYLSGTLAPPLQRANCIRELFKSNIQAQIDLGVQLLASALKTSHFSSVDDFDFGAHSRSFGWQPDYLSDFYEWYNSFIDIAVEIGSQKTLIGSEVRKQFASNFRGLWAWTPVRLDEKLKNVAKLFYEVDGWAEGWNAVMQTLEWDKTKIPEESLEELKALSLFIKPKSLIEKIHARVLSRGWEIIDSQSENTKSGDFESVKELGQMAGKDEVLLGKLLPSLLKKNDGINLYDFGRGIAQSVAQPKQLLTNAKSIVAGLESSELNLAFICGFISEWNEVDTDAVANFLDEAVTDSVFGVVFPGLQAEIKLNDAGFHRLLKSLNHGLAPILQFSHLTYYRSMRSLSVEQIMMLISLISKKSDWCDPAISILRCFVLESRDEVESYRQDLADRCAVYFQSFDWKKVDTNNHNLIYELNELLEFTLYFVSSPQNLEPILRSLIEYERSEYRSYSYYRGVFLRAFFKHQTKQALDIIYQPDEDGQYEFACALLDSPYYRSSGQVQPFADASVQVILEWCAESPDDRYNFIIQVCPIFDTAQDSDEVSKVCLTELAKHIFKLAPNKVAILERIKNRIYPNGPFSDSLSNIILTRISIFDELALGQDADFIQLLAEVKATFEQDANERAAVEDKFYRVRNESFE